MNEGWVSVSKVRYRFSTTPPTSMPRSASPPIAMHVFPEHEALPPDKREGTVDMSKLRTEPINSKKNGIT